MGGPWLPAVVALALLAGSAGTIASLASTWRDLRRLPGLPHAPGAPPVDGSCGLDEIALDWLTVALPALPVWLGDVVPTLWLAALGAGVMFGIGFQAVSLRPGRDLSALDGLRAALTDAAGPLAAWLLGLAGALAAAQGALGGAAAPADLGAAAPPWRAALVPPLGLLAGFVVAYPINWRLVRAGLRRRPRGWRCDTAVSGRTGRRPRHPV